MSDEEERSGVIDFPFVVCVPVYGGSPMSMGGAIPELYDVYLTRGGPDRGAFLAKLREMTGADFATASGWLKETAKGGYPRVQREMDSIADAQKFLDDLRRAGGEGQLAAAEIDPVVYLPPMWVYPRAVIREKSTGVVRVVLQVRHGRSEDDSFVETASYDDASYGSEPELKVVRHPMRHFLDHYGKEPLRSFSVTRFGSLWSRRKVLVSP